MDEASTQPASFFKKRPVFSIKETYSAGFPTPSQRVCKAHGKKLAKSRLQFLSRSFYLPDCYQINWSVGVTVAINIYFCGRNQGLLKIFGVTVGHGGGWQSWPFRCGLAA
jgi:hypothetical protein